MTTWFLSGVSGAGKSTRTRLTLLYLDAIGKKSEPIVYGSSSIGLYYPEVNMNFYGKHVFRDGMESWQGIDILTAKFGTVVKLFDYFRDVSRERHQLIEGASVILGFRMLPPQLEIVKHEGEVRTFIYTYADFSQYQSRIQGRSGYLIESTAMWGKNSSAVKFVRTHNDNPHDARFYCEERPWDSSVEDLARDILPRLGIPVDFDLLTKLGKEALSKSILKKPDQEDFLF